MFLMIHWTRKIIQINILNFKYRINVAFRIRFYVKLSYEHGNYLYYNYHMIMCMKKKYSVNINIGKYGNINDVTLITNRDVLDFSYFPGNLLQNSKIYFFNRMVYDKFFNTQIFRMKLWIKFFFYQFRIFVTRGNLILLPLKEDFKRYSLARQKIIKGYRLQILLLFKNIFHYISTMNRLPFIQPLLSIQKVDTIF